MTDILKQSDAFPRNFYIDDTDVETDNRDVYTTELTYKDEPGVLFIVDTRFAAWLARNALENMPEECMTKDVILLMHALSNYDTIVADATKEEE